MKRNHDVNEDDSERFKRQSRRSTDTVGEQPATGEFEEEGGASSSTHTKNNGFPILQLPRELRDRIYDFHLQATCETSRVRNWGGIFYSSGEIVEDVLDDVGPIRPGYFFEPVFIRFSPVKPDGYWHAPDFEAREHPIPPLTLVKRSWAATEAWSHYSSKLLVHVDALNRFQTWCLETLPRQKYVGLRRLFVLSLASYLPPPDVVGRSITDEQYPCFLLQIVDNGTALTLSSRFRLRPDQLELLNANLNILMLPILRCQKMLDGEDLVEAMLALHCCRRAMDNRQQIAVGPMRKGGVMWEFEVDDVTFAKVPAQDKPQAEVLLEAAYRVKSFRHVLYRGQIGKGKM